MASDASAYTVLGLSDDADWPSVEGAYKALIKAHHPDRPGGDPLRAAEINRAYRELRQSRWPAQHDDGEPLFDDEPGASPHEARHWFAAALALPALAVLLVLLVSPLGALINEFRMRALHSQRIEGTGPNGDPLSVSLDAATIRAAVVQASRMVHGVDEASIAEASRTCYGRLHLQPSVVQLDHCAAFDDAVVQILNRDPLGDDGPFSQVAITGRAMSAAGLFSDDFVEVDARLRRIRHSVEQALAPAPPPPLSEPGD